MDVGIHLTYYERTINDLNIKSKQTIEIIYNNWGRLNVLTIPYTGDKKALKIIIRIILKTN